MIIVDIADIDSLLPLQKKIFIINGSGGVGKDTFVELVSIEMNDILKKFHTVWNYSSVDKVKEVAKEIGWDGGKTEKDRKFLSDLKILSTEYCDMPFKSIFNKVYEFRNDNDAVFLFIHIREPEEIKRATKCFNAKTILVVRDNVKQITSNIADKNVFDYDYDLIVVNNGTIEDLQEYVKSFVNWQLETK